MNGWFILENPIEHDKMDDLGYLKPFGNLHISVSCRFFKVTRLF